MKMQIGKKAEPATNSPPTRAPRRQTVAAILRAAYGRFAGDATTQRAVRRFLPAGRSGRAAA